MFEGVNEKMTRLTDDIESLDEMEEFLEFRKEKESKVSLYLSLSLSHSLTSFLNLRAPSLSHSLRPFFFSVSSLFLLLSLYLSSPALSLSLSGNQNRAHRRLRWLNDVILPRLQTHGEGEREGGRGRGRGRGRRR